MEDVKIEEISDYQLLERVFPAIDLKLVAADPSLVAEIRRRVIERADGFQPFRWWKDYEVSA